MDNSKKTETINAPVNTANRASAPLGNSQPIDLVFRAEDAVPTPLVTAKPETEPLELVTKLSQNEVIAPTPIIPIKADNLAPEETLSHCGSLPDTKTSQVSNNHAYNIAFHFMNTHHLKNVHGSIYFYDSVLGFFVNMDTQFSLILRQNLPEDLLPYCSNHIDKEVAIWLRTLMPQHPGFTEYPNLINFRNGVFDIVQGRLLEHSPSYDFTYCLDFDYVSVPKRTPVFDAFLHATTNGDERLIILLLEFMGYVIANTRAMKSLFFLYGPSNTGKSVFINLLQKILGEQFTSSVSLSAIGGNFRTASLVGSRLNSFAETDTLKPANIPLLKSLTGGDRINADVKFQKPVEFENKAILLFSTNELGGFDHVKKGDAFWNRLIFLPFTNVVPANQVDPFLLEKLSREIPDIISKYAVLGWTQVYNNGCRFTAAEYIEDVKDAILVDSSSVKRFVATHCKLDAEAYTLSPLLFKHYNIFCKENGLTALGRTKFYECIENISPDIFRTKKKINQNTENVFFGIELIKFFNSSAS